MDNFYYKKYLKYKKKFLEAKKGGALFRTPSNPDNIILRSASDSTYYDIDNLYIRFFENNNITDLPFTADSLFFRLHGLVSYLLPKSKKVNSTAVLYSKLWTFLQDNMDSMENILTIQQFYYYLIFQQNKRLQAFMNQRKEKKKEVYLVIQNQYDDQTVFANSSRIYSELTSIGNQNNTQVMIYHTINSRAKAELEANGAIVKDSLNEFTQYIEIFEELREQDFKISFLYFSSHGSYVTSSKKSSIYGLFSGVDEPPSNLDQDIFEVMFQGLKELLSIDCILVLNSCYLGQINFEDKDSKSSAELISKLYPSNTVIAARSALGSGSFIQEFYIDPLTQRLTFNGNILNKPREINRMYGYCLEATKNIEDITTIWELFDPETLISYLESF